MPFARPTLSQLRSQVLADIAASDLPGADSLLRKAVLRILGYVQAGLAHLHFGYLDFISKMALPWTAQYEYAEGWAALVGITRKPATAASGEATITGTNGTVIPIGTGVSRSDSFAYVTTTQATITGGTANVAILATTVGSTGNADTGTYGTLTAAIPGAVVTCTLGASDGFDIETDDALRARYLEEYRAPPHGGDATDYEEWALAVPGVTRAWCVPHLAGAGTVTVFAMEDGNGNGGFPVGTNGAATAENRAAPATGDLLTLANAIFLEQPVTALVYACAPTPQPLDFTIYDLVIPPGGTAAIQAALADALLRLGDPRGGRIAPSQFESAIQAVPGVTTFSLISPSGPVAAAVGSLFVVGTVTYGAST